MPGLYSVATRAPGTLITALIYNGDHQAHVNGRNAIYMQSYGVSTSQYTLTEDPYPGSVESLAPSFAGEITRLRFVIAQIKTALSGGVQVNWYDSMVAPALPIVGARVTRSSSLNTLNITNTVLNFTGATEQFNTGVWSSSFPTRFTAPSTGKYFAFSNITWTATAGGMRQLQIGVNGSFADQPFINNEVPGSSHAQQQAITGILNLTAGDYVEFNAIQTSGGALTINPLSGGLVFFGT